LRSALANALAVVLFLCGTGAAFAVSAKGDDSPPGTADTTTGTTTTEETTTTDSTIPDITDTQAAAAHRRQVRALRRAVAYHRQAARRWETVSFTPLAPTHYLERRLNDVVRLKRLANWWSGVRERARYKAYHPPHLLDWMCIHSGWKGGRYGRSLRFLGGGYDVSGTGEGSWSDSGSPYYGGLQMDLGFMRSYGARLLRIKGTADHWTPLEQMWVGEQALKAGRGFYPWPRTARACGLI
jgi:hypothetical protein